MTVRSEYLEKHPDRVKAFVKGWYKALEYWKSNPDDANKIMAKALDIDLKEFELMLDGIKYADEDENKKFFDVGSSENSSHIGLCCQKH